MIYASSFVLSVGGVGADFGAAEAAPFSVTWPMRVKKRNSSGV